MIVKIYYMYVKLFVPAVVPGRVSIPSFHGILTASVVLFVAPSQASKPHSDCGIVATSASSIGLDER